MMRKTEYNPKLDYLVCRGVCQFTRHHHEMRMRAVYSEFKEPKTKNETRMLKMKKTYEYLLQEEYEHATQAFDERISLVKWAVQITHLGKDNQNIDSFIKILTYDLPIEVLILLFNAWRINRLQTPIVFSPHHIQILERNLLNRDIIRRIYEEASYETNRYNQTNNIESSSEVKGVLKCLENTLKEQNILELYIYGSVAKNTYNQYSDIDLIVVTSKVKINQGEEVVLKDIFEKALKSKVDLMIMYQKFSDSKIDIPIKQDLRRIF